MMPLNNAADRLVQAAERYTRAAQNLEGHRRSIEQGNDDHAQEQQARREYVQADLSLRDQAERFLDTDTGQDDPLWLSGGETDGR